MSKGFYIVLLRLRNPNEADLSPKKLLFDEAKLLRLLLDVYKGLICGHWKNIYWILNS